MSENMNDRESGKGNAELEARDESPRTTKGGRKNFNDWWRERTLSEKILAGIGFAILGVGMLALLGLVVMLLWNWLMPDIFGLKQLNYWQAWGLLLLSTILFKGLGSNSSGSGRSERKRKEQLRRYMREDADTATGD